MNTDCGQQIIDQIKDAVAGSTSLNIIAGNSKQFYGRHPQGEPLFINQHSGIVSYEPTELVITARAGTKINQIQSLLSDNNQMLGFEPALCNADSTLGGVVAAGLAGPARVCLGSVRDFILGVKMINGNAELLKFGGQVMKNVAGFDHSRLMAGSLGTLGVLLEISLRVLPKPKHETTVKFEHSDPDAAIKFMNQLLGKPYPVSAATWFDGLTRIRLSGTQQGVASAVKQIGGDSQTQLDDFWLQLCSHQLEPLKNDTVLYRVSVPGSCGSFIAPQQQIIDWGGAQRWLFNVEDVAGLMPKLKAAGASLSVFRGGDRQAEVFDSLDSVSMKLHQNIKRAFDPKRIFNPGRMYKNL